MTAVHRSHILVSSHPAGDVVYLAGICKDASRATEADLSTQKVSLHRTTALMLIPYNWISKSCAECLDSSTQRTGCRAEFLMAGAQTLPSFSHVQ